ncbi:putative glucan endo-1,3-beta-D-glucosidase [Helianthus annuus]|nr:putative glucan endo-1,3-beta-D-glucosidase [Helianthus annuus]KAJ0564232.1 putative glucan endo-1,3-beta-D-glucosidase [Helianthus annuus]KAJ0732294.1 putative glucan endo-1,3-beta-D-glucosidase [Helianthus annuus]
MNHRPFTFPETTSTVVPSPTTFFSPNLLSSPLPTNSFFQNFTLKTGNQPEYIHPYLIKSSLSSLSISYPSLFSNPSFTYQIFNPDLTISVSNNPDPTRPHVISSFNDLSLTLDIQPNLRFFLVRGSPFITCQILQPLQLSISTVHAILDLAPNSSKTRFKIRLNNGQTWVLYSSSPINLTHNVSKIESLEFSGVIRIAVLPNSDSGLDSSAIETTSSYFYGKLVARAARFALIAEEIGYLEVIPKVRKYLKETIEPWLDGTFGSNGFLYDRVWGGLVTKQGATDTGADFGFGIYNDHHFHIGYFLYGIAVLAKIDPIWGLKYRPQAYSLMADFMTLGKGPNAKYTRLRCFDLWKLHSWASGLTEFTDGRNQESTSEAVNAYYSAALMGLAYGDAHLVALGSLLTSMEIHASQTWWHVKETDTIYAADFTRENRVVGVLWANKRDSGLWFAPAEWKECRLGIQVLPLLPITEPLFSDAEFARQLVEWTLPALEREGVGEGWKGFVYALQGVYDKDVALEKIRGLNGYDDGNSLSNLLWWIFSRGGCEEGTSGHCWFGHYCH